MNVPRQTRIGKDQRVPGLLGLALRPKWARVQMDGGTYSTSPNMNQISASHAKRPTAPNMTPDLARMAARAPPASSSSSSICPTVAAPAGKLSRLRPRFHFAIALDRHKPLREALPPPAYVLLLHAVHHGAPAALALVQNRKSTRLN